jgi:hypothetical protein
VLFYWFAPGARSDDWVANHTQALYGMPNNTGWLDRFISGLSYNTGVDNVATTGNIDVMQGGTWLVGQNGLQSIDQQSTNWVGSDPTDLSGNAKIGGATVITNVSSGPLANYEQSAECDRVVCPSAGAAVLTRDAGINGFTKWWDLTAYPKASDAGTANPLRLWIASDGTFPDGGHEVRLRLFGSRLTRPGRATNAARRSRLTDLCRWRRRLSCPRHVRDLPLAIHQLDHRAAPDR